MNHESTVQGVPRLACLPVDRARIELWARATTAPHRLVLRSQIVLLLLDGHSQVTTSRLLGVSRDTVCRWEKRFLNGGAEALQRDQPGRGRRPGRNAAHVARVREAIEGAPQGAWTIRRLAAHVGVSAATVQRIWREHAMTPAAHLTGQIVNRRDVPRARRGGKPLAIAMSVISESPQLP